MQQFASCIARWVPNELVIFGWKLIAMNYIVGWTIRNLAWRHDE
jgi:hypothetical protein